MGLFDDDFYSPKFRKSEDRKWKKLSIRRRRLPQPQPSGPKKRLSTVQIAVISSVITSIMAVILYSWIVSPSSPTATANEEITYDPYERIVEIADKVSPTVVSVVNKQKDLLSMEDLLEDASLGSGVIYKLEDGKAYIITNEHVVQGADLLEVVLENGQRKNAELVGKDRISDIAVLRIDGAGVTAAAEIGDSQQLRRGETVIAIGNPLGFGNSLTGGLISYTNRVIPVSLNQDGVYDWEQNVIQIDAAINEGNSGGPLVDLEGRVVGINTMKISTSGVEGIGFAIPSNEVMEIVEELMEHGKVSRPYIGVYTVDLNNPYAPITDEMREDLMLPDSVEEGVIVLEATGPAQQAGLELNDVVVKFDNQEITSTLELRKYLYNEKEIGEELVITFYREGKLMTTTIKLSEKPDA